MTQASPARIQIETAKRAAHMLNAVGAQYHIVIGTKVFGAPVPGTSKAGKPKKPQIDWQAKYGFGRKVREASVGDVLTFQADSKSEATKLRTRIATEGFRTRGAGGVTTTQDKTTHKVEVLIVSDLLSKKVD